MIRYGTSSISNPARRLQPEYPRLSIPKLVKVFRNVGINGSDVLVIHFRLDGQVTHDHGRGNLVKLIPAYYPCSALRAASNRSAGSRELHEVAFTSLSVVRGGVSLFKRHRDPIPRSFLLDLLPAASTFSSPTSLIRSSQLQQQQLLILVDDNRNHAWRRSCPRGHHWHHRYLTS